MALDVAMADGAPNDPPVLGVIGPQSLDEGAIASISLSARSVSTFVLPEPADASTQAEISACEASCWISVARKEAAEGPRASAA